MPVDLELEIDRLRVQGLSVHDRDALARAIEVELDRLVRTRGLPFGQERGTVDVDLASFEIAPQASVGELGAQIARELVGGLHQRATGRPATGAPATAGESPISADLEGVKHGG